MEIGARLAAGLHLAGEERASFLHWARQPPAADQRSAPAEPRAWLEQHSPASTHNDLLRPPTALIGRERDVAAVRALLASTPGQLVTLVGPPGIGKTRLSLQVAAEERSSLPDGVFFVPLAAIHDPELVLPAIAQTLGVHQAGGQPLLVYLRQVLTDKQILLVLDNIEQIVAAAAVVDALLAALPRLMVLVTSRVPLHVYGEQQYTVPPLAIPDLRGDPSVEAMAQVESVRLFVQRAKAVQFGFRMTPANAAPVAAICRRLEGLPLAIELAAARIKVLSPEALLRRLDHSLDVLTGGASNLPPRHRTLRAAIAWSYKLLSPDEQVLLRRLAVFAGGWTLDAAEAISTAGRSLSVLDGLQSLIDHSLVQRVAGLSGEPRYGMLELTGEYALEQLLASGEQATIQARHTAYYCTLAETVEAQLAQGAEAQGLASIAQDADNVRAAMQWARTHDPATALALASVFAEWCLANGSYDEGRRWLVDQLERTVDPPHALRARALLRAALLAWRLGDDAVALADASLKLYRQLGDGVGTAWSINTMGLMAWSRGDVGEAASRTAESLALARAEGEGWGARSLTAILLINLGVEAQGRGDDAQAWALYEEGYAIAQAIGQIRWMGYALLNIGDLAQREGDSARAGACYAHSAALNLRWGDKPAAAACLQQLAWLVYERGRSTGNAGPVVRLLGAAAAAYRFYSATLELDAAGTAQARITRLKATLGDAAFRRLWDEGQTMPLDQVISEALSALGERAAVVATGGAAGQAGGRPRARQPAQLTARERAVLCVVAEGATDLEVAQRLGVRPRTVTTYLTTIYAKLEVHTRTAAVRMAREQHLI